MQPQLLAEVTLYARGGRKGPVRGPVYGCSCLLAKDAVHVRDCRILLDGKRLLLGQPCKVGFVFLSPDSAAIFKAAGRFYLWEGKLIGEAVVLPTV